MAVPELLMTKSVASIPNVIILDDEKDILDAFTMLLEDRGYSVTAFSNPISALAHITEDPFKYSIIISDIKMPMMNGIEFAMKVRQLNPHVSILLMTAFELKDDIRKQIESISPAIDRLVQKPVSLETLLMIVEKNIRKKN